MKTTREIAEQVANANSPIRLTPTEVAILAVAIAAALDAERRVAGLLAEVVQAEDDEREERKDRGDIYEPRRLALAANIDIPTLAAASRAGREGK